jgi:hypothetical protein
MSNLSDLVESVKIRASDPQTRADHPQVEGSPLPAPANVDQVTRAEQELGFRLPELLARLYCEVANGGFGPGYGLIGLSEGQLWNGQSIVDVYKEVRSYVASDWNWPDGLLPICDWGCAILMCVDCKSEDYQIVFSEEGKLTRLPCGLFDCIRLWCSGGRVWNLFEQTFDFEEVTITNPFTKKPTIVKKRVPRGTHNKPANEP